MKAAVDPDRCQGDNRRCALAPGLSASDELGDATPSAGQVRGPRTLPSAFPAA